MAKAETKRDRLLQDADVRRWYDNSARGSPLTAEVRVRRLSLFCEQNKLSPQTLVELGKTNRKQLEDLIQDYVTRLEKEKKAPGYIAGLVKSARSWLDHNEIELKRKVKIANQDATPTLQDERVPTKDELHTLLLYGSERAKAIICLVAQAGLRLESLGNEAGTDGLTIGDLPEMKAKDGHIEFQRIPTMVVIRPGLSKARHRYFTFLPKEGCDYLAAYLEKRLASGETLTAESPIIAVKPGFELMGKDARNRGSRFITTRNISREIRETMRPRFQWRPYVLRAYFDTQLLLAESHGKLSHPYRVFFMGHKGDIEARYTTNKGRLPSELVEDMRRALMESEQYLSTIPVPERDRKELLLEMFREQAKIYGIDPMRVKIEKQKQLGRNLTIDEEMGALQVELMEVAGRPRSNQINGEHKIVSSEKDLVRLLNQGWEIIRELGNHKILVAKRS